jgi:hypothetical protein
MVETYGNVFPQQFPHAAVSARVPKWKDLTSASRPYYPQLEVAARFGQLQTVPVEAGEAWECCAYMNTALQLG